MRTTRVAKLNAKGQTVVSWGERGPSEENAVQEYKTTSSGVLLGLGRENCHSISTGTPLRLRAFREAQLIFSSITNMGAEPDFHWQVLAGQDLVDLAHEGPADVNGGDAAVPVSARRASGRGTRPVS